VAKQQFGGFGAFLFCLGILLIAVAAVVGFTATNYQVLAAGALIGLSITSASCFIAAAMIYQADRKSDTSEGLTDDSPEV
jgi:hypothetical protein